MGVKAVFFDLDGTLLSTDGRMAPAVSDMLAEIRKLGLKIVIGSNHSRSQVRAKVAAAGIDSDLVLSRTDVGVSKPSPKWCFDAAARLGVHKNQMVYVGDDNRTDAICAINAGVLFVNARWSNPEPKYGIIASAPQDVVRLVRAFLLHDPIWYWQLQIEDTNGTAVDVKSVLPGGRQWDPELGPPTFDVLKQDIDREFPVFVKFSRFLLLHFLSTIYLAGLHDSVDTWCIIPPSSGNQHRKLLPTFIRSSTKLFKAAFVPDLIQRHRPSQKAAFARAGGADPGFLNQANTLHLHADHRTKVIGKHVLVIDDYCTRGHSFEAARHLLYRGGAAHVSCVSVGRYGSRFEVQIPRQGLDWDPWLPQTFTVRDFQTRVHQASFDLAALAPVKSAFAYLRSSG